MKAIYFLPLVFSAVLGGCATAKPTIGPNGRIAYSIRCGAALPDRCLTKAGEVCPLGYTIVNQSGGQYLGQLGSGSLSGSWNSYGGHIYGASSSTPLVSPNSILVECR